MQFPKSLARNSLKGVGFLIVLFTAAGSLQAKPKTQLIEWIEEVLLPDKTIVEVKRAETFAPEPGFTNPVWAGETIWLPNPRDPSKPIKWEVSGVEGSTIGSYIEPAMALYYENGLPRIVTHTIDLTDEYYGCSYTEHHRLFTWDENSGWHADIKTRIHTTYVGLPNLIYGAEIFSLPIKIERYSKSAGSVMAAIPLDYREHVRIDTLHEKPLCLSVTAARIVSFEAATQE